MDEKVQKKRKERKYSRTGCLVWAVKKLWKVDRWFVFFIFATVAPVVLVSLAGDYFPKVLIDHAGAGEPP